MEETLGAKISPPPFTLRHMSTVKPHLLVVQLLFCFCYYVVYFGLQKFVLPRSKKMVAPDQ